jgi:acetoin utilization protein AcuB
MMMRLSEIMSTDVRTVTAETTAAEANELMRENAIHHLVVVNERRRVVGIVTAGDVGTRRAGGVPPRTAVGEVMSQPVVCAELDTTIRRAANLLRGRTIGCLPVLDGGKLIGIVTLSDLLELLGRGAISPSPRGKRPTLTHRTDRVPGVDRNPARRMPRSRA